MGCSSAVERHCLLLAQIIGIISVGVYSCSLSLSIVWAFILKGTMGIRVPEEEEIEGLDIGEHGNVAYPRLRNGCWQRFRSG